MLHTLATNLAFFKKIWQVLYCISSYTGYIIIATRLVGPQRFNPLDHILRHFDSYFHAENHGIWEHGRQSH